MALDASIPLQVSVPDPTQQARAADAQLQLQQDRQKIAGQNALRQLFSQPGALDANGMPSQNALARIMQIDPATGMALRDQMAGLQERQAQTANFNSERATRVVKLGLDAATPAKQLYDQQVAAGVPPAAARANAQVLYSKDIKTLATSGALSPQEVAAMSPTFDPNRVASGMDWLKFQEQKKDEQARIGLEAENVDLNRQRTSAEIEKMKRDEEAGKFQWQPGMGTDDSGKMIPGTWRLPMRGDAKPQFFPGVMETKGQKWELLTDPTKKDAAGNPMQYRYNATSGEATTLDGKPYQPGGAAKIASAGQQLTPDDEKSAGQTADLIGRYEMPPLSGFVLKTPWGQHVMADLAKNFPDYQAPEYNARNKAFSAFSTGPQGNIVRSLNVSIAHLDTLQDLATALQNGDVKKINSLSNLFKREFGSDAPTNFQAAKQIVGTEIIKAITGSSAAEGDRQQAQDAFDKANSPEQLVGAIGVVKNLLAGQMHGLKKQYEYTTKRKDFDELLAPATKAALGIGGSAAAAAELPAEAIANLSEGQITTFANGQKWTLRGGKPEQVP